MSVNLGPNILYQLQKRITDSMTPDFVELKQKSSLQPVFVYGTLKKGHRLHDVLSGCPYLGRGITSIARWDLKNAPQGSFPIMFKLKTENPHKGKVCGEVYAVDPLTMLELDEIESNGRMYQREKVHIRLRDQHYKTTTGDMNPSVQCWTYVGVDKYWEDTMCWRAPYTDMAGTRVFDWKPIDNAWSDYIQTQASLNGGYEDMDDEIPFNYAHWGRGAM